MKIAGVQMDVSLGDVVANVDKMIERLRTTDREGAELTVFPECTVSGYCFKSLEEAHPFVQSTSASATERLSHACADLGVFAIFGMLEADGQRTFNTAVLVGPEGVIGTYRKIHLPFLGIDRHAMYGDRAFAVHNAGDLRVGMNICYDATFPEASRSLAILGADLIALPTNWPAGAECVADHVINTRALENNVYYIAVNRVGIEGGFQFIGLSRICAPNGQTLASSSGMDEEIIYAEIDLEAARNKRIAREPGCYAIDRMADRRPEMYKLLTQPHGLTSPGRE